MLKGFLKTGSLILGFLCLGFGLGPLMLYGYFHAGSVTLTVAGTLAVGLPLLWDRFPAPRRRGASNAPRRGWRRARVVLALALGAFVTAQAVFAALLLPAAYGNPPPKGEPVTIVVLGCAVRGDQPSKMLQSRLQAALNYQRSHPDRVAGIVVTGGLGAGKEYTEAQVMARWLEDQGVDPALIHREEAAADTQQNLAFSAQVIQGAGLPRQVAIASDGFHQFRAAGYARRSGLTPYALPAQTPWGLLPGYWVREELGILRAAVLP